MAKEDGNSTSYVKVALVAGAVRAIENSAHYKAFELLTGNLVGNVAISLAVAAITDPNGAKETFLAATSPTEHGKAILLRHDDEYIPATKENIEYYKNNIEKIASMTGHIAQVIGKIGEVSNDYVSDSIGGTNIMSKKNHVTSQKNYTMSQKDLDYYAKQDYGQQYYEDVKHDSGPSYIQDGYIKCFNGTDQCTQAYNIAQWESHLSSQNQSTSGDTCGGGGGDSGGSNSGCYLI